MNGFPTEVNYFQGQRLTATLFRAEQAYHITMRERHNLAGHDWGIALGLDLTAGYVDAGYAIDGYGRELILPARTEFPLDNDFDDLGSDSVDVSLVYHVEASGDYTVEKPVIQVDRAKDPVPDRRRPEVTPGDAGFDATGTAPRDNLHPWPVYLGTITRDPAAPAKQPIIKKSDRPYVGARAAQVMTPAGDAHLDLGLDVAVYTGLDNEPVLRWAHGDENQPRRLEVRGELKLGGDLHVNGGRVVLPQATPEEAGQAPDWQLDHVTTKRTDPTTKVEATVEQLRLVLGTPEPGTTSTEFVIGCFANGQFKPCLTVDPNGTVTVHGNLVVEGTATSLNGGIG